MPHARSSVYILPVRWSRPRTPVEMTAYLRSISRLVDVVVVDSSPDPVFEANHAAWGDVVRHVRAAPRPPGTNGKVVNVLAGLAATTHELVVIADDDVRYTPPALRAVLDRLLVHDVVRPQNYFLELPWHARWDSARTLLNRAWGGDYPGTLAVRRSALEDGYASDVLFENLELVRTVRARGGSELVADEVFVGRTACRARTFAEQRVRQAYDSQAQPVRLAVELAVVPVLGGVLSLVLGGRSQGAPGRAWRAACVVVAFAVSASGVAELGRRRRGAARVFPASCVAWAPVWVLERGVCSWLALVLRLAGGAPYAGGRVRTAAHSVRALRRAHSLDV